MDDGIEPVARQLAEGRPVPRDDLATATRAAVALLASRHPGRTIEVRVPPFAAVQVGSAAGDGPTHRRGTPPNVVEMAPETMLALATGRLAWDDAVAAGMVHHSGAHAQDVARMLPL